MKKMIKKVIAPVLVITVLFAVLRPFCIQDGKCNYFLLLLLMGIPFGIGKMCVWMVPKGFDLGGTLAVWTMNLLIGGLIGSIVLLAMIGQAIIYLCVFLITVLTGIHKIRMIEIYLYSSVGAIPFATMSNREWGQIGNNYLRGLFALAFQGFFMMVCVGIYAVLVANIQMSDNIHSALFGVMAYTVILCFSLMKTGNFARSIFNAH